MSSNPWDSLLYKFVKWRVWKYGIWSQVRQVSSSPCCPYVLLSRSTQVETSTQFGVSNLSLEI